MMMKLLAEFLGTFVFFTVILTTQTPKSPGPVGVAIALLAAIYFVGNISGGHFNPGVSYMMYLQNSKLCDLVAYVASQLLATHAALWFFKEARAFY